MTKSRYRCSFRLLKASFVVLASLAMTTCDLFKAGLGPQIDIASPTVDVSSIANGAYLRGTVTLTGSASDDVGLTAVDVIVTINSTQVASVAATIASGAWQAALDTKALSGGVEVQADLDIRATDSSGKATDKKIVVYFDNVAPVITGMSPSSANLASPDFALSEKTTITGSVKDGLGLAKTALTVGDISLSDTTHPGSWSLILDTAQFYDGSGNALHGATKLASGLYQVGYSLISTDYAGNTSEPLTGLLYVNPDGSPVVNIADLTAGVNPSITYPRASSTVKPTTSLPGIAAPGSTFKFRVTDLDGIDVSQLYVALALGSAETANLHASPSALPVPAVIYKVSDNSLKQAILDSASLSGGGTVPTRAEYSFTLPDSSHVGEYMLFIYAADYAANKVTGTSTGRYLPAAPSGGSYTYSSLYVTNQTASVTIDLPAKDNPYSSLTASGSSSSDDGLEYIELTFTNTDTSTELTPHDIITIIGAPTTYAWSFPKVGLPDGHYSIAAQAKGVAVFSSKVSCNFVIDTSKPIATPNAVTAYQSGNIGISGTSSDTGSGVAKVEYQLDSTSGAWTTAGGSSPWSGSLNLSLATEGAHTLYARATDLAGNVTDAGGYASTVIDVDRANPRATETNYGATLVQGNSAIAFAGIADDAQITTGRQAGSVSLSYSKDGAAATTITRTSSGTTDGFSWDRATGAWSWILPAPTDHSGDGLYSIIITATESKPNPDSVPASILKTASVTRSAQIDTTAPTLVVSSPANGESTSSTSCTISGTSRDTGGVGFDGVDDVQYNLNGTGWKPAPLSGSWSVSETLSGTEGAQVLVVRSTDKLGNASADTTVNFFYDLAPPVMVESNIGGGSNPATNSSSTNSSFFFSGTTYDSDALAGSSDLQVAIDYAAPVNVSSLTSGAYMNLIAASDSKNKTWRLDVSVGSGGLADGVHNFVFTAKDIAGKTASVTRTVTVDTASPVSVIGVPASLASSDPAHWLSGATASVGGSSSDTGSGATGVASVYYAIAAKGAGMPAFSTSTWTLAAGTTNWNGTVKLSGAGGIGEGEFTLYEAAIDAVGNIETPVSRDFGVDQSPPEATEAHAATFATKASFTLSGDIKDTNALKSLAITESRNGGGAEAVTLSAPATVGGVNQSWSTASLPIHGVVDGSYAYSIVVTDVAGKTYSISRTVNIDTTPPTVTLSPIASWVSGSALTIGGGASDSGTGASGVAKVEYSLDGGAWTTASWTDSSGGKNTSGSWTATLSGLAEGSHALSVKATDAATNVTAEPPSGAFGVDFDPPALTAITPTTPIIQGFSAQAADFSGTIGDTNAMAASESLTVSYTKNGGSATVVDLSSSYIYVAHSTANAWSWQPFGASGIDLAGHANDGIYVFTFTATDIAGKPTTVVRNLTIDTMAPQITMTGPTNPIAWYKVSPLKVTGVANDGNGSGVKNVYVRWDVAANDHSADAPSVIIADWTPANNTVSWNADLALSTEGAMKLWIKAEDNYGNWTTPAEAAAIMVNFGYDKTSPTFNSADTTPSVTNQAFTLGGNLSDAGSGLKGLVVSVNGVASTGATYSAGQWSYPVSSLPSDGSYTYAFTATDNADNVSTITRTVYVDTTAPAVAFNNIDPAKCTAATAVTLVDASPKVTGSITDDTGVGTVTSTVQHYSTATSTWVDVEVAASLATSGSTAKSRTFSKDLSAVSFAADGLYRITITAGDMLGAPLSPNAANSATVWFRLDRSSPTLPALTSSAASANVNADFTLSSAASSPNLSSVQWKLDDGAFSDLLIGGEASGTIAYTINLTGQGSTLAEGSHTITVQATSTGLRTTSQGYTFLVDRTAPAPTVSQPTAGSYLSGATAVVSGGATDSGSSPSGVKSVEYQLAAGLSVASSGSTITAAAAHGFAAGDVVRFEAYSGYSLPAALSASTPYYVRPGFGTTTFEVSTTSGGAAVAVGAGTGFFVAKVGTWKAASFGGNSWSDLAVNTASMSEGNYILFVRATDNAGNASSPLASRVCVDQGEPSLAFTGMPSSGVLSSVFSLSGTAVDAADASLPSSANGVASVILSLDDPSFAHTGSAPQDLVAGSSWSYDLSTASAAFYYGLTPTTYAGVAEGSHTIYARATDKAGRTKDMSFAFTKDSAKPVVAYSNLSSGGSTVYQDNSSIIMGTFTDASGVASMSARIEKYDYASLSWSTTGGMAWADLGSTGNSKSAPFEINIGSSGHNLLDGRYRLSVIAADVAGDVANTLDTSAAAIEFIVASADPSAAYTAPALGSFQRAAVTVTGTASDPNAISSVLLKCSQTGTVDFGSGFATATLSAATWSGGMASYTWSASVPVTSLTDGAATIYVQASAGSGRKKQLSRDFTLDTAAPAITITSPSSASRSVGSLTIVGTTNDPGTTPSGVTGSIQYQLGLTANLGNPASWTNAGVTGGAYSWSISLGVMSAYANATYATKCDTSGNASSSGNLWRLPIYFQAFDNAGNVQQLTSFWLILDPDGNIPSVTITQPSSNGQTYGGQQRISGTASQPIWIHDVEVAIDPTGGSSFPEVVGAAISGSTITAAGHGLTTGRSVFFSGSTLPQVAGSNVSTSLPYFVVSVSGDTIEVASVPGGSAISFSSAGSGVSIGVWGPATLLSTGNNVMWYYDINQGSYLPQGGASSQTVSVQARAWNSPSSGGSTRGSLSGSLVSPLTMKFDSTFPKIQGLEVSPSSAYSDPGAKSYYNQITVAGQVYVLGYVQSSKGITKIEKVETSNGTGSTTLYDCSGGSFGPTAAVTPPASVSASSLPYGGSYQIIVTSVGDTPWASCTVGGVTPTAGTVVKLSSAATGTGAGIPSDSAGSFSYYVAIPVNTDSYYPTSSGVYSFDIRATDMTVPSQVSSQSIALNADNYHPTTTLVNPGVVAAGNFVAGQRYMVVSVGTTDFTAVGALANGAGQTFVATGLGSGSGTAIPVLVGTAQKLQGSATDTGTGSGTIGGLAKVVVYLTNPAGTQVLDLKNGAGAYQTPTTLQAKDMANSGIVGSVKYPVTTAYSNYFASIDSISEIGAIDTNGDGFLESFLTNGNARDWWAQIDTTVLYDGPVTVHAVIWDNAGNATHYAQAAFVSNHAPALASVYLGTDVNGDGTVAAGEINSSIPVSSLGASNFIVRNGRLLFQINLASAPAAGNSPAYYSVKYDGNEYNGALTSNTITISNFSSIPDSGAGTTNDRAFTIFVYDSASGTTPGTDSQFFTQTVRLTINNVDHVAPSIDLAPFGQRWSVPTDSANGGVNTNAGKTLGLVSAYTDNVAGAIGSLQGHVEYAMDSNFNPLSVTLATPGTGSFTNSGTNNLQTNSIVFFAWTTAPSSTPNGTGPYYVIGTPTSTSFQVSATMGGSAASFGSAGAGLKLSSPDVSGKVIFRGKFVDDQRIASLTVTIPGYNSGNPVTLATWSASANSGSGGLAANTSSDWSFTADTGTESASMADGHVANWAFAFDTSKITTVAAANVPVTFAVTDGGSNTGSTSMNVDIVPYITDFSRQAPFAARLSANLMNPSADGYYPVYQGASGYVVSGFNLYYSSANVTVGATALTPSAPSTTSITVAIPSNLLPTVGAANAYLAVTTNGIASINNGTNFTANSSMNANGALFSSYLTEEGSFTNARKIYVDDQAPSIAVADLGQKYPAQATDDATNGQKNLTSAVYSDNVTYSGSTWTRSDGATTANWLGHAEYKADNVITASRAAVSGVVTLKGKAFDNERIALISASIPGFDGGYGVGNEFPIYTLANGFLYYNSTSDTATGSFPSVASFGSTGTGYTGSGTTYALLGKSALTGNPATWTAWADGADYKLSDSSRVALGHVLNWNFSWDSSKLSTVAATGVVVTFTVYDANNTAHTSTASLTVDVAPYITGVTTSLNTLSPSNPSVYNRTALGKYPVNESETIQLTGFNLVTAAGASAVTVTGISGITASAGVVAIPMTNASTGSLPLTVNSVALVNNLNTNARDFDKLPNGINNSLLTDDIALDVWHFNNRAAVPISGQVSDPVMKINPVSGMIGFAFTNGPLYYSMPGTFPNSGGTEYSYMYAIASYDFLTSVALAYDNAGHTYAATAGGDINSNSADKFVFMTDRWGKSELNNGGTYNGTNTLRMESIGLNNAGVNDFDKYRIKSPSYATSRIATSANSTNVYLAYFDNMRTEIAFRYGNLSDTPSTATMNATAMIYGQFYTIATKGTTTNAQWTAAGADATPAVGESFIASGSAAGGNGTVSRVIPSNFGNFYDSDTAGAPPAYSNTYKQIVAGSTTGRNAGEYVSLGVIPGATISSDVVVMVWYDATAQCLWYSYNTTPATNRAGTADASGWSAPSLIFSNAGEYCQIAVDGGGGIHIAAYDTVNASLLYAHLNSYSDTSPASCVVDSYGIVGTNITLDVAQASGHYIPYIGYYAQSSIKPKYAYLVDTSTAAPAGTVNDYFTGAWDVTLLPTASSVSQDRINVGVWKDSSGVLKNSVGGTSSYTKTGSGYTATNYGFCYGIGGTNSNGVLAYQIKVSTNGYIETAQKK